MPSTCFEFSIESRCKCIPLAPVIVLGILDLINIQIPRIIPFITLKDVILKVSSLKQNQALKALKNSPSNYERSDVRLEVYSLLQWPVPIMLYFLVSSHLTHHRVQTSLWDFSCDAATSLSFPMLISITCSICSYQANTLCLPSTHPACPVTFLFFYQSFSFIICRAILLIFCCTLSLIWYALSFYFLHGAEADEIELESTFPARLSYIFPWFKLYFLFDFFSEPSVV